MKKLWGVLFLTIFILAGCVSKTSDGERAEKGACDSNDDKKIGFVTDSGGINDKSFNQSSWEGIEKYCYDNKVGATYIESSDDGDFVRNLSSLAEEREVVVASGFLFENAMFEVATKYPDVNFILVDGVPRDPSNDEEVEMDNVSSYLFNETEAGYLAGYVAAQTSGTGKYGFIGGMEIPTVERFGWGYVQGIQDAKGEGEVYYQYAGKFDAPDIGKTMASSMYDQGVDTIFIAAGGTGIGAVTEAIERSESKDEDIWVVGVDKDMYEEGLFKSGEEEKSVILTSALKRVDQAIIQGLTKHFADDFEKGVNTLGFEEDGVGLPEENPNLDSKYIEDAQKALKENGVVDTEEETLKKIKGIKLNGSL